MPRVAIFASQFHPHLGGVEELVRQQAHHLRQVGCEPVIFTNRWPKDLPARETFEGLDVRREVFRVPGGSWRQTAAARVLGPMALHRICRALRERRAEVLHVQCMSSNAVYAVAAKRRLGLPLVVTLQGEFTMDAARVFERPEVREGARAILRQADAITACSARTLADGEALCGASFGPRGRVIFNGADGERFRSAPAHLHGRPYLFALGRLVPQKGFDVLIRAVAQLGDAAPDVLIAGDGPERAALQELIGALGRSGQRRLR